MVSAEKGRRHGAAPWLFGRVSSRRALRLRGRRRGLEALGRDTLASPLPGWQRCGSYRVLPLALGRIMGGHFSGHEGSEILLFVRFGPRIDAHAAKRIGQLGIELYSQELE